MGKNYDYLKHFEDTTNKSKVKCLYCPTIMGNDRSYNMKKHLLLHGIDCLSKTQRYKSTHVKNEMHEPRKHRRKEIALCSNSLKIEMSQTQLIRAYIGLVAEDNVPLHVLNSQNFKNLIDPICAALSEKTGKAIKLNASNCEATINLIADVIRDGIKCLIKQRLLSIKIECGEVVLGSKNTFIISTQFVYNDELKSLVLGVIELTTKENKTNLRQEISKTLHKYDIKLEQIIFFTKTHDTQLYEIASVTTKESPAKDSELGSRTVIRNTDKLRLGDSEICASSESIAQQCARAIINADEETRKLLYECQLLTKYLAESPDAYDEIFEIQNFKFPQTDSSSSWCTIYNVISEILANKDVFKKGIHLYKSELSNEKFEITDALWDFMDNFYTVLSPLHKALQKFQEEHMHIGNFYAQWLKCQILTEKLLEKCANSDNLGRYKLCELAVEHIRNCTLTLLTYDNFNACLYMDPRFQHTLDATQRQKAIAYLKQIWDRLENPTSVAIKVEPNMDAEHIENNELSDDEEELLNSFLSQELKMAQNKNMNTHFKIENLTLTFLRSDANVLEFWKERKDVDADMYALSNVCFGIPATQVSIEREVPNLKTFVTNHEYGLDLETLENILLVKLNPQYLDEAIEQLPLFECEAMEEDES